MTRILRIDASSRTEGSHSRKFADRFLESWFKTHPDDTLAVRDLALAPIPHIAAATIAGFYSPPEQLSDAMKAATALSDQLITELRDADLVLISTPMYNFSIPSALKAWIDQIVRINHTFSFSPEAGLAGLLRGKRAIVITAAGAVFSDNEAMQPMDFMTPYLKFILGFIGIDSVEVITLEGTTIDPAAFERSQAAARNRIENLSSLVAA